MTRLVVSSILLLVGCTGSRRPEPSPPGSEPKAAAGAAPATDAKADSAPDVAIDLEALASDPQAALPGSLVRHGRYDVRQLMHERGFVVAMTEELVVHALGGRFVGRIASKGDETPPSSLVFVTDDQGRLEHLIWQSLPGSSEVTHEFSRIAARSDGPKLEIVRTRGLSSSIQRVTVPGPWTLDGALALELLPLWSTAATARPEQAEWVSIQLQPVAKAARVRLAQRGKETLKVGGHEVDTWRYQAVSESPLSAVIWVDEHGLVVRRLEQAEGEAGTQWDTIYVPLAGDRLAG